MKPWPLWSRPTFPGLPWFRQVHGGRIGLTRNLAKVLVNFLKHRLGVDVTDNREHGVVWRVVSPEERRHVRHGRRIQVGHRPDSRVSIGEIFVRQFIDRFKSVAIGLIVDPEPAFLLHRLPLIVQILQCDVERSHPVGL